jgi:hypothetical protein
MYCQLQLFSREAKLPFDGSGNFNRIMNWVNDAVANIKIRADRHDTEDDNFAAGLSMTLTKDGQSLPTNNIQLNGKRLIAVADPINAQDALTKNYFDTQLTARVTFVKRTLVTASTTTFQFDPTTTWALVEVQGAGGAGGFSGNSSAGVVGAGGGGGAGGYCSKIFPVTAAIRSATKTITIGAGGTAAAGAGNAGGLSSYGDTVNTLSAPGGQGGLGANPTSNLWFVQGGGPTLLPTGGDINVQGEQGGWALEAGGNVAAGATSGSGGKGADSRFGAGAAAISSGGNASTGWGSIGGNAVGPGAGGSGAVLGNVAGGYGGGAGVAGLVAITEFR